MATLSEANANLSVVQQKPPKMYVQDLKTFEIMKAQFNPTQLEEAISVEWVRLKPPGLSHERLQYDHTTNHKLTFELVFDALEGSVSSLLEARKFLLSVCYSKKGAQTVLDGQATRVLMVWPGFISLTCVITGTLKFTHTRFNVAGSPTLTRVNVTLEEIRDTRIYSEDVRQDGTQRSSDPTETG